MAGRGRLRLEGRIAGVGFSSGHRFVAGLWERGPLGPMVDVMWARPDGSRTLLASSPEVAQFVGGVYRFEETFVVPVELHQDDRTIDLHAGPLRLTLQTNRPMKAFSLRPRRLRRSTRWVRVEDALLRPLAGPLLLKGGGGVRLYGRSPSGVREWYCIDSYRRVQAASGTLHREELGSLAPLDPPARFGFSEFPRRPAVVDCAPVLQGARDYLPPVVTAPGEDGRA